MSVSRGSVKIVYDGFFRSYSKPAENFMHVTVYMGFVPSEMRKRTHKDNM